MTLLPKKSFKQKREELRDGLRSRRPLRFIGSFSPLVSAMIEDLGFEGIYVSGSVVAGQEGWPDVGLTTLSEVTRQAEILTQSSFLPSIVDGDTGFGESLNSARLVMEMEKRGLSGLHIEDQAFPKRCGHLNNKKLISTEEMVLKIKSSIKARQDKNFLIIARTDAYSILGIEAALERAEAYKEAGADMIFPEALPSEKDFEIFRDKISLPLLANMTEFGKTDIIEQKTFEKMGYNIVIYPVTTLRLALKAVEKGLKLLTRDKQKEMLPDMQPREQFYELLKYEKYKQFDKEVFSFSRPSNDFSDTTQKPSKTNTSENDEFKDTPDSKDC